MAVEEKYRKTAQAVATYDFFESILGVGFKNFYPATGYSVDTETFFLTTDATTKSDDQSFIVTGLSGTDIYDLDFDIPVERSFTIAAKDATFSWTEEIATSGKAVWTVRHVDSGATETSLGTVTAHAESVSGPHKKLSKATLTRKQFKKGETLRINVTITAGASGDKWFFDPSGLMSFTEADYDSTRTIDSNCTVKLPIEVPT